MSNMIPKQSTVTSKKVKYVGTVPFINGITGEVEEMEVQNIEVKDFNFNKVFMKEFLFSLDQLGNKKIQTATYILEHADSNNVFYARIEDIKKDTGFSNQTIVETIKILREANFMRREYAGKYIINPDIIAKGSHQHRLNICHKYNAINADKIPKEQEVANLKKMISKLQGRLDKLTQE